MEYSLSDGSVGCSHRFLYPDSSSFRCWRWCWHGAFAPVFPQCGFWCRYLQSLQCSILGVCSTWIWCNCIQFLHRYCFQPTRISVPQLGCSIHLQALHWFRQATLPSWRVFIFSHSNRQFWKWQSTLDLIWAPTKTWNINEIERRTRAGLSSWMGSNFCGLQSPIFLDLGRATNLCIVCGA